MHLIIGLGNPGKEYERSRHNAGFMFVDALREKLKFPEFALNKKFNADMSEGEMEGEKMLIVKPQTFMNRSGEAVKSLANFYKCPLKNLWLIYDDIDLALGKIRIRSEGSAGTHNGMKSVIEHLGKMAFPRLRLGIESRGDSAAKKQDITSFVLHPFSKEEFQILKRAIEEGLNEIIDNIVKPS